MKYSIKTNNYKEVLQVSLPLVLSMGSMTVMEFTDRIFLGNYNLDTLAAATPAGITSFLFASFFIGVANYVNVFIAQYTGAGNNQGVGASLWQGLYFAILGTIFMVLLGMAGRPIFNMIGHPQDIIELEIIYFKILCFGAGSIFIGSTLSCFYSGRGLTKTIMFIHISGMIFNIPLDYALIYGKYGFPELGIKGAAIATVSSWSFMALIFAIMVFNKKNNQKYHLINKRAFDSELFMRLMKYGVPGGIQFCLDILVFTFFVLIIGKLGKNELTITNLSLSVSGLFYMPMWGLSMGASTLVGQAMGSHNIDNAVSAAKTTTHIALIYITFMIIPLIFKPVLIIKLFLPNNLSTAETGGLIEMGVILLRFVAVYLIFDSLITVYSGVLKGAGDSRFIMCSIICVSLTFLFIPLWSGINYFGMGLYFAWSCITSYLVIMFIMVITRYYNGKWKKMQIIEN